jgi:hypothetical protein
VFRAPGSGWSPSFEDELDEVVPFSAPATSFFVELPRARGTNDEVSGIPPPGEAFRGGT